MRRERIIRRKRPLKKQPQEHKTATTIMDQSKQLFKHPIAKGVVIVAAAYGVLFISKYIIREYAQLVIATKKLRDAHRL